MNEQEHREGLIKMYEAFKFESYSEEDPDIIELPFQHLIMTEALRKLKETKLHPKKIENWVVGLEKAWSKIK